MDYISTKEVAKKWNTSTQTVIYYASADRIVGAVKSGGRWLIPAGSAKPSDDRSKSRGTASRPWWATDMHSGKTVYGPHALSTIFYPPGKADRAIASIDDVMLREQLRAEICYLRGHFSEAEQYLKAVRESQRKDLHVPAWFHSVENAVHMADWALMLGGLEQLNRIAETCRREGDVPQAKAAELAADTFLIVANTPERCRDWIQEGDFSELPGSCLVDAAYARCKYLQNTNRRSEMISEYHMASSLIGDNPFWRGYPAVMAILAYSFTKQTEVTDQLAQYACNVLLEDGIMIPITDSLSHAGQFLLRHIASKEPDARRTLLKMGQTCYTNWIKACEIITQNTITNLLTIKEMETLSLASNGMSNKEIAKHLGLSTNTIKLRLQTIYDKLQINSRKELVKFNYHG